MAVSVDIRADVTEPYAMLGALGERRLRLSLSQGVNDTARQVKSYAARLIAREGGLRAKVVRENMLTRWSSPSTLEARVIGVGRPFPLVEFQARQTRRGVTAAAWGTRKVYPGTFIATMRSGHKGVFARKGKARLPIKELWGPSVPSVFAQHAIMEATEDYSVEKLEANVIRRIDRALWSAKNRA